MKSNSTKTYAGAVRTSVVMDSNIRTLLACAVLGMALCTDAQADPGNQASRFASRHADAEKALFQTFKQGSSAKDYASPLFDLTKYETFMTATGGVRVDDYRLLGHLADEEAFKTMSTYDFPRFVLRMIEYRLAQRTGIDVANRDPFAGRRFEVTERQ
jgi:hypothetical protein